MQRYGEYAGVLAGDRRRVGDKACQVLNCLEHIANIRLLTCKSATLLAPAAVPVVRCVCMSHGKKLALFMPCHCSSSGSNLQGFTGNSACSGERPTDKAAVDLSVLINGRQIKLLSVLMFS